MEKDKIKKVNISRLLLYVSVVLIFISVVMYFVPFVKHTEPYSLQTTTFSGFDFTKALFSNEQNTKMFATKAFFEMESTKIIAYTIAILGPICFIYSLIMLVLTAMATYHKKLNNIFAVGGFFSVWIVLVLSVLILVGKLSVTIGAHTINNYSIMFGIVLGALSVLSASVLNIFASFME